ncbi:hypothetical protein [Pseudomonas sp. efr-133-TYG-103a]|uniref:hypothetical protein n=1 Tax=Pseudomonas sp. efr-133-TYG-103a TaxID=3040308 RepID=UPI0025532C50|nr:hypothetical protein [Pseudomonas sp. efr-133-TYG-103a]
MTDILIFAGFSAMVFTLGIALWVLGQWLRSKGYGPQLDKLDRQYTALQLRVSPLVLSASYRMIAGAHSMNHLPLLGSKSNAALTKQLLMAMRAEQPTQKREG